MAIFQALGPYEIIRRIGKGGMGEVYLATDTRKPVDDLTRAVALKVLWHDLEREAPGVLDAERQGAQLQSRLYSIDDRVVRVNAFGDIDDCFFIDMEYIAGRDLAELIQQGPVPVLEATRIAIEVADILLKAHTMRFEHLSHDSRGIVHGDVKPRNIRLEDSGRVRLMDFGIAKALSMTRKLTRNEFGSVTYASPERLDTGEVNEHSDLWSLAVVLYEMVCGTSPFTADNTRRIEQLILSRTPPRAPGARVPAPLWTVLVRAMAPRLEARYLTAVHFKKALQAALREMEPAGGGAGAWVEPEELRQTLVPITAPSDDVEATRRTARPSSSGALVAAADIGFSPAGGGRSAHTGGNFAAGVVSAPEPDVTRRTIPWLTDLPEAVGDDGEHAGFEGRVMTAIAPRGSMALEAGGSESAPPAAAPLEAPPSAAVAGARRGLVRWNPVTKGLVVLATLAGVIGGVTELRVARSIPPLVQEINGRSLSCEQAWARYRETFASSLLHIGMTSVVEPLVQLCSLEAEQVIKRYRTDDPRLIKSDWARANAASRHVMALAPSAGVDAWEHYTRGHVLRIEGKYDQARAAYDKAAELDPEFCGPFLALVQMYAYNQPDLQGLLDSRARAEARGCTLGKRQEIQLADAQHRQADKLFADDRDGDALEDRKARLNDVRKLLTDAQAVYRRYPTFGDAKKHLRAITKRLKEVDERLEAVAALEVVEAPEPPPLWGAWPQEAAPGWSSWR